MRWFVRAGLTAVAVALVGVFAVAAWLEPYDEQGRPRTMSTHTQLGVPDCNFLVLTGKPCPSCGMTTSFALLVRGDVGASLRANWVGTLLAITWAGLLVWSLVSAVKGRFLGIPPGRGELILTAAVGIFLVLMLARWGLIMMG